MVVILMGVAGSGKTTVGRLLAGRLGWMFYDGDDFHPPENVAQMSAGLPLTDAERAAWLSRLAELLARAAPDQPLVLACSALKQVYRQRLNAARDDICWVYLRGSPELIAERLAQREGHFMKPGMLASQFEALEEPRDALVVEISLAPEEIASRIISALGLETEPGL